MHALDENYTSNGVYTRGIRGNGMNYPDASIEVKVEFNNLTMIYQYGDTQIIYIFLVRKFNK